MVQFLTSLGIKCTMYVDDLLICADDAATCARHMEVASAAFWWLGFICNAEKQEGPARSLEFLGYILDTKRNVVTIGEDRQHELLAALKRATAKRIDIKELETLIGKLSFAAGVLQGTRTYVYRLYKDFQAADAAGDTELTLSAGALLDVRWWLRILSGTPPASRIFRDDVEVPVVTMKSDASGDKGWGYLFDDVLHWSRFSPHIVENRHIQCKELIALVHTAEQHGERFHGKVARFGFDNASVC